MNRTFTILASVSAAAFAPLATGCVDHSQIVVDLSADEPRFIIHHPGFGWPFLWPRVQEFAIASDEDGSLWELRSTSPDGVAANQLAITYGEPPDGFFQAHPAENARPRRLKRGCTYYLGANGTAGSYRGVFALPIEANLLTPEPDLVPGATRDGVPVSPTTAPADPAG